MSWSHRWRVTFSDGTSREVTASTSTGAEQTALMAEGLFPPRPRRGRRAIAVHDLGHAGTRRGMCPHCDPLDTTAPGDA